MHVFVRYIASCYRFSWGFPHFPLFLQIFGLEHRVTGRATQGYKEKVLERHDVIASTYRCEPHMGQELQSDRRCCDGECGKHVLLSGDQQRERRRASDSNPRHIYYRTNEGNMEETRLITLSLTVLEKTFIYLLLIVTMQNRSGVYAFSILNTM